MNPTPEVRQFGKQAVDELDARLLWLQTEWAEVSAKRSAWMLILGDSEGTAPAVTSATPEQIEVVEETGGRDVSEVARQIINATAETGFEPKDVTAKLKKAGFDIATGFSSNLLFRMKKKGEVVEHNGKYYLPRFDPKPRLNMSPAKDQGTAEAVP